MRFVELILGTINSNLSKFIDVITWLSYLQNIYSFSFFKCHMGWGWGGDRKCQKKCHCQWSFQWPLCFTMFDFWSTLILYIFWENKATYLIISVNVDLNVTLRDVSMSLKTSTSRLQRLLCWNLHYFIGNRHYWRHAILDPPIVKLFSTMYCRHKILDHTSPLIYGRPLIS